ncbi:MAG: hypothetical protein JWP27_238 [Flaviaesturariibacter sp.]|nr:hypothetical protein [Flaviaesturariibacter sp.]
MKKVFLFLFLFAASRLPAQELQAKLTVMSSKVGNQVDKKIFNSLQTALSNFLNNRKWTSDTYQPSERIKCNFLISIDEAMGNNVYRASLTVQAARPIYNTTYESPLINFQDNDFVFRYVEFQPIEFNENRVQGNDPLVGNITATLAYYANIIVGLDYDSFSPRGGDPYYQKALNIVNSAPESRDISGWKAFDGIRNRYRLVENLTDNRFAIVHDVIYSYYRLGLDMLIENEETARTGVLNTLNLLSALNRDNPNMMYTQVFFQGKSNELARLFSKAPAEVRTRARELLTKMDITNVAVYNTLQ